VNMEFLLLVTIARCARVARFVRSRTVINASNKINWYWIVNVLQGLNPVSYWKKIIKHRQQAHLSALGLAEESGSFVTQTATADDKRTSRGVLQIGIMAAVHAQAEAEAHEAKDTRGSIGARIKRTLRSLRLLESETSLATRHAAAIKIQRAWRGHLRFEMTASNDGGSVFGDFALGPETDEVSLTGKDSHHSNVSYERLLRKRLNAKTGGKLDRNEIRASMSKGRPAPESRFQSQAGTGRESQVGSDMRELTGQRVAIGVLLSLVFTVVFTYTDSNTTRPATMIVLHKQTQNHAFQLDALYAARETTTPDLYKYQYPDGAIVELSIKHRKKNEDDLREREKLRVTVTDQNQLTSVGWFAYRQERVRSALTEIVATIFIIIVWFFGVTAFAGPVMSLVVVPIERMVRLLGMLMLDPLGYQATARFKKFLIEEDALIKNTRWTKEVLKGMETSFLMSTILRIGSLMKVGFGSAGVEIIRNNLQKGQSKNMLILNSQGSTVSCIFLFCDIRQFTDATECLQEEVFVFTNRIAAVIHSICHSYGGAANKNVGDAFLLSWSLEDGESKSSNANRSSYSGEKSSPPLKAKANQADKALLSVIKICIALYYDKYYLEALTDAARNRLTNKLIKRVGPVVQMGFGLHAGKAVQGAIGSQRKIDATYVSEAVERAEFLESSTKQYGLKMLMSGDFHRLLHPNTRRRCRKIDQILLQDDEGDYDEEEVDELQGEIMSLYTFDMDVEAIHRPQPKSRNRLDSDAVSDSGSNAADTPRVRSKKDRLSTGSRRNLRRRRSVTTRLQINGSEELFLSGRESGKDGSVIESNTMRSPSISGGSGSSVHSGDESNNANFQGVPELVLPTGPALYSHNVWQSPDMKRIRDKFVQSLFFQKFNAGLQAFYGKDWDLAKQCFQTVLENFDDGPSKYFMEQIKAHKGVPPKDFKEYGLA
jgi:class 3 adenylate cyclase